MQKLLKILISLLIAYLGLGLAVFFFGALLWIF